MARSTNHSGCAMRNLVTMAIALLAVGCGGAVSGSNAETMQQMESAQSSGQAKDVACGEPFKGSSWGTTVSTVEFPLVHNVFTGPASLSGLGRSQIAFPHDWNLIDKSVTGSMTITAANGDELFAHVTGSAMFRPDGLIADLDQFGIFDGGTGRFVGAEGSFSIIGTITRATGAVVVDMDGYLVRNRECD